MCYRIEYYHGCGHYQSRTTDICADHRAGKACKMTISERQNKDKEMRCAGCQTWEMEKRSRQELGKAEPSG